jgi:hypothetical protein
VQLLAEEMAADYDEIGIVNESGEVTGTVPIKSREDISQMEPEDFMAYAQELAAAADLKEQWEEWQEEAKVCF